MNVKINQSAQRNFYNKENSNPEKAYDGLNSSCNSILLKIKEKELIEGNLAEVENIVEKSEE